MLKSRIEIELLKRSIHENVLDLNYFIQSQFNDINEQFKKLNLTKNFDRIKEDVQNRTK